MDIGTDARTHHHTQSNGVDLCLSPAPWEGMISGMKEPASAKIYVDVHVEFRSDGIMLPREIIWEDGRRFEIDRVLDIRQAAAMKAGGQGDRYTIKVQGQERYLFFERNASLTGNNIGRWFIEARTA